MDRIVEAEVPILEVLLERWHSLESGRHEFLARLSDEDVARPMRYETADGKQYEQPLGEQMAHVVNHGTHFRAEAAVALTSFGFSPGDLDLMRYLREVNPA
jgi:uncharacterized damage-inducible protein DinB